MHGFTDVLMCGCADVRMCECTDAHCDAAFGINFSIFKRGFQNTLKDIRNVIYYNIWAKKSLYQYEKLT